MYDPRIPCVSDGLPAHSIARIDQRPTKGRAMPYFADITASGPVTHRLFSDDIGVLEATDIFTLVFTLVGTASQVGHDGRGLALWRLRIAGALIPGLLCIVDRLFFAADFGHFSRDGKFDGFPFAFRSTDRRPPAAAAGFVGGGRLRVSAGRKNPGRWFCDRGPLRVSADAKPAIRRRAARRSRPRPAP